MILNGTCAEKCIGVCVALRLKKINGKFEENMAILERLNYMKKRSKAV